ncbi:PREDICTED: peroxisome assembly factor 2-like [Priapulus caudatus]|uniref:Peroxisomal ATPase PEX6 n=1 Tax=Priapulus caudatus TaxID=37621 RepID=A0ABM1E134_PRICU|nr:PREDICTED: peroxisome assembly factor 2-like [Priapulus caudatus]
MSAPVSYMSSWKFKLYSFEIGHHPLHIGIPKEHSHGIFWKESSDECIVSIKDSDHVKKVGLSCLFAHLHCIKVESDKYVNTHTTTSTSNTHIPVGTYSHPQDLHVLCTEMFLRHYGFHCDDSVVINRVNMFPLERVVLAAKSDSVFSWLKSQEFMTGLLLSVCEGLVLCRKGDVLLSPISELLVKDDTFTESRFFDTVVLDCEPQNQGLLTLKSEIIITHAVNECCDNSDLELKDSVSNMASLSTCDSNDFVKVDQVGDELNLQISSDDDTLVVSETVPQSVDKTGVFHPCIMPQSFLNQGLCDTSLKDDGHVIGVTSKVLNEQRITNGSWVVIEKLHSSGDAEPMELTPHPQLQSKECIEHCSFNSEVLSSSDVNHGIKQKPVNVEDKRICEYPRYCSRRLVQVHAIEKHKLGETMKDKIVYMSPLLWFNFNVHPSQLVQEKAKARIKSLTADTLVDERVQLGVQPNDRYPSHAKEVHIAIVESPEYSPKADYTSVLQAYFVEHRLLSEGDIFCISLKHSVSNMASLSTCDSNDFVKVDQVGDELNLQISSDDDTLVVSETVPNLGDAEPMELTPHPQLQSKECIEHCSFNSEVLSSSDVNTWDKTETGEPHAKEVHIAIVESPEYSPKADYTSVLQAYFVEHRLLSEGDIFCISLKQTESIQQAEDTRSTRSPAVYFKVMKLLPLSDTPYQPAALVDIQHTSLFQAGTVQSFVPMLMKTYLTGEGSDVMWDWPMPAGLVQYSQQLMNAILPHLHNRCECREVAPTIVVTGPRGVGKNTVVKAVAKQLNMHIYQLNCYELHGETSASSEAKMKNVLNRAQLYAPCILLLRNIHIISKDREGTSDDPRVIGSIVEMLSSFQSLRLSHPVIIVGTTSDPRHMPAEFFSAFLHEVVIKVPSEAERADILHALLAMRTICHENVSVLHLAQRTAGMVLGDLCALVAQTNRAAYRRVLSACTHQHTQLTEAEEESIRLAGVSVRAVDFEMALDQLQAAHADVIGAPKIPNVTWEDVGGLTDAKTAILDTIQLPLRQPELFAAGMRRSGLLLYGPPGTGKTLLAKAVATECSLNFLSVKGPELINMYVGQSEENVREVFSRARTAAPSVIFFDELDSLAPNRGRSGDSGGVSDRVVSQLLAELDGLVKTSSVFVIAATNRPDLLDPALLRPGRFDKLVYVGVSRDKADQLKILTALTRKFNFSEDVDIREIVDDCPANLTGADFYALCSDSMLHAITRNMDELERGTLKEEDIQVTVNQSDFRIALRNLVPSVSENELARYQDLDTHFNL